MKYHLSVLYGLELCKCVLMRRIVSRFDNYYNLYKSNDFVDKIVRFVYDIIKKRDFPFLDDNNLFFKKGDDDMSITATELKTNLGKYLMLAETEDIYITRNGKVVAKLSNPYQDRVDVAKSLFGVLSNDMTLEEAREERLNTI